MGVKNIINRYVAPVGVLLLIAGLAFGCSQGQATKVQEVTFEQFSTNPSKYSGRHITIEGFYFSGFELVVLSEGLEYSGYAEGHIIPKGRMLWIEGGIPQEVYGKLYQQNIMGPSERYGKVRIKGKFEYGGRYGHLGSHEYQISPTEVELLPWSPEGM